MKRLSFAILICLFICIGAFSYVFLNLSQYADTPVNAKHGETFVTIRPGEGFGIISEKLLDAGVIQYPIKFECLARLKGYDKRIKAGEYRLSSTMPPSRILETLVDGKVFLCKLTLPEGYSLRQIASVVAEARLGREKSFLQVAGDPAVATEEGIEGQTVEGYLFPDTYHFPKSASEREIISAMVRRFWAVFMPEWRKRAEALNFSVHQVVTLGSIIEKETGVPAERPLISSVFHNRLKRGMRLQTDPTVIYGIKDFDGNLTRKHLRTRTPYNTYKIKGLPPGPIASPGKASIKAALFPAETRFLYFVSKKDKTHQFSTNLKAHNRAVRKYQLSK